MIVLVLVAILKHPRLGLINKRSVFLTLLESGGLRPRVPAQHGQVLVKAPFWVAKATLYQKQLDVFIPANVRKAF